MVNTLQFFCLVFGLGLTAGSLQQSSVTDVIGSSAEAAEISETDADTQNTPDIEP